MKRLVIVALAPMLFAFCYTNWKQVQLASNVTVNMPGDPTDEMSKGVALKKLKLSDGTEFSAAITDLSGKGITADMLSQMMESGAMGGQIKTSIEAQNATVTGQSEGEYKGVKYFQFDIQVNKDGKVSNRTSRSLFFQASTIQLIFMKGADSNGDEMREQFFNSLEIK